MGTIAASRERNPNGVIKMGKFVNREAELSLIDDAVQMLQSGQLSPRSPIIEFYGINGIGKTTLLKQVEELCRARKISFESKDVREVSALDLAESTQRLLGEKKPVVVILDSFDANSGKELGEFELKLRDLVFTYANLFVVLASKSAYRFDNTRSVTRKLEMHSLKPLEREYCLEYLDGFGQKRISDLRELIYEWTRGYPLAMDVIVDGILTQNLDPHVPQDQKMLVAMIADKVINQSLLVSIHSDPAKLAQFQKLLTILSLPRSFNLVVMQELIERYAPEYTLPSSLAYITQPNDINKVADIISWNMQQSGYCIDSSIRNIFLLKIRIENPELYTEMNEYLMMMNRSFAVAIPGPDRVRYLREYLYHLAKSQEIGKDPELLIKELEQLITKSPTDHFLRFYEEFWQDKDLRETLGNNAREVITFLRRRFFELYKQLPEDISRFEYLLSFLARTLPDALVERANVSDSIAEKSFLILKPAIRQIMQEETAGVYTKFYDVLSQDQTLNESLGKDFERILLLFGDSLQEKDR